MADKVNIREAALDTLVDMEQTGKLSHIATGETLMRLQFAPKQDRAFYTLLCEGTTEQRIYLDYVLDRFSRTKMKKCRPLIRNLLRLSAYQILFTGVRDAAACNEAVKIARKRGFGSLSGFVNGVLRSLVREKAKIKLPDRQKDHELYLSVRYSMPLWIVKMFCGRLGPEVTEKMLVSFAEARPVTIRTNLSKINPEKLSEELKTSGLVVEEAPWFSTAFYISGYDYIGKIPAFRRGCFSIQDISSMLPVSLADLSPGDTVVDLCAAPGGKAFHAADIVGAGGQVIARDLTEYKTELIKENNDRIGYHQIKTEVWDATIPDKRLFGKADLVLADLPCSGLGIMGRKNDIKYHISPGQLEELAALQRKILAASWRYVKPGGQLIYSTCTINTGENEENVRWIRENTPLKSVSIEDKLPPDLKGRTGPEGYLQILPGIDKGDGFFAAKFILPDGQENKPASGK
ncbi:MAG: 16S rRNA (cytosine(967)-C(5))-methyltransferase RsmB [Eubacterium sp.]|nr:16S rRNA (cytosine(967)-C(5))-methyltransferase RsmB [Eubacterium sp.]